MRIRPKVIVAATAFSAMMSSYALAYDHGGPSPGNGWANGWGHHGGGSNHAAPGPVAGAGLPFLVMAGAYALVRRHRARKAA